MIQIGGVYTTFCQEEGILLQKYRDTNGRCIAILFKSIGVRGRLGSPEQMQTSSRTSTVLFLNGFRYKFGLAVQYFPNGGYTLQPKQLLPQKIFNVPEMI